MLKANKNVKGILLFPLASIIAEEMNGPTKEDALPTIENNEKKRNSFPRGQTSEIILPSDDSRRRMRLAIGVERANRQAENSVEGPNCYKFVNHSRSHTFPNIVIPNSTCPDTGEPPSSGDTNPKATNEQHCLRTNVELFLYLSVTIFLQVVIRATEVLQ